MTTKQLTTNIFSVEGKTAVVLGGTSGIGHTLSLGLADAGADVVASARRQEQVDATAAGIERRGRRSVRLCSDVCNRDSLEQLLTASVQRFGKVDILINHAQQTATMDFRVTESYCTGKIKRMSTLTVPEEEWADIVNTNLAGTLRACQIFGKHMLERGYCRVVTIALAQLLCCAPRSRSIRGQQGRRCVAHTGACRRVVEEGDYGKRHRARCLPHHPECRFARQHASRSGTADANTDRALRQNRRTRRSCRPFLLRCRVLCFRAYVGCRRRFSRQLVNQ
jgi:short chain dehydrogenase